LRTLTKKFWIFILSLLLFQLIPVVAETQTHENPSLPVFLWPLNEDFKVILYNVSDCYPYFPQNRSFIVLLDENSLVLVKGNVYFGCNIPGQDVVVKINGYNSTTAENFTETVIHTDVYTNKPVPYPIEIMSENVNISYEYYNETYALIKITFSNLSVSPELEPQKFAFLEWPSEMEFIFYVNMYNGDSYLLDGTDKIYVGSFPLLLPELDVATYFQGIEARVKSFVETVKLNPWILEGVMSKAMLSNSTLERNAIISNATLNVTHEIMTGRRTYLGLPIGISVWNTTAFIYSPYVDFNVNVWKPVINLPAIDSSEAWRSVDSYLQNGSDESLKGQIESSVLFEDDYAVDLLTNHLISVEIPLNKSHTNVLVLPLPKTYREKFNATYLLVLFTMRSGEYINIHYDPRIFDPDKFRDEWKIVPLCSPSIYHTLIQHISDALYSGIEMGDLNMTIIEDLYPIVQREVRLCSQLLANSSAVRQHENVSSLSPDDSINSPVSKTSENRKICGPAALVGLATMSIFGKRVRNYVSS